MSKKDQIRALLKSIETGDPGPIAVVNEAKYIQHNPQTHEGSEGLAVLFKRLSETSPRVNIVRAFEDGKAARKGGVNSGRLRRKAANNQLPFG